MDPGFRRDDGVGNRDDGVGGGMTVWGQDVAGGMACSGDIQTGLLFEAAGTPFLLIRNTFNKMIVPPST